MSFELTRSTITAHFQANWNPVHLPIVYENQQEPTTTVAWGRFVVLQNSSLPMTIGNQGFIRSTGAAMLQMFIPEGKGTKIFTENTDRFATIYNLRILSAQGVAIHFQTAGMSASGKNSGWLQRTASVIFRADTGA
jgi:hypothetical protein